MEAAGFAFATLGVAQSIVQAYKAAATIIGDVKHFEEQSQYFAVRLQSERVITIRLRDLLFARKPDHGAVSLFDKLDELTQKSLNASFHQFARTIAVYLPLEERYHLSVRDISEAGHSFLSQEMVPLIEAQTGTASIPKSDQLVRNLEKWRWAFRHKGRAFDLLREIEQWNKRITRLVQQYFLEQKWLKQTPQNPPPKDDPDFKDLGIGNTLDAYALATSDHKLPWPDRANNIGIEDCELPWHKLPEAIKSGNISIGRQGENLIIIDPKSDDRSLASDRRVKAKARLDQLATILRVLHRSDASIANCLGWVDSVDSATFSLIFKLPEGYLASCNTMLDTLPSKHTSIGPSLEERMQLAYQLATTLSKLHSVSWLHKNLRSENIYFFHRAPVKHDISPSEHFSRSLIFGFEYSRHVDQKSSLIADTDIQHNIYRHPARWGIPTAEFRPIHDIYALGVILLELGLWRKLVSLDANGFRNASSPLKVTEYLISRAKSSLPFLTGATYCDIVVRCLERDFGEADGEHADRRRLVNLFSSLIVDELRALAFPRLVGVRQMIAENDVEQE